MEIKKKTIKTKAWISAALFVAIILGVVVSVQVAIHQSEVGYNLALPSNAIQFTTPNDPYKFTYTNDYIINLNNGTITINSFYSQNLNNGKYKLFKETITSTDYTLGGN
jgi:hypothetical protein